MAVAAAQLGSATSYGNQYSIGLLQLQKATSITAQGFSHDSCDGFVPATEDGWHFVAPGGHTAFISLSLTFTNGTQLTTPTFVHNGTQAYVASTPGAVLTAATAEVHTLTGYSDITFFVLSSTCPASSSTPTPTPSMSSSPTTTTTPTPTPTSPSSSSPTVTPTPTPSPSSTTPPAPAPTPVSTTLPVTG